ncbi:MAG: hypothetical protein IKK82_03750 [Kiritimatiellae bacterium]|nr:hypothetical protein [Kiritimatiellia bacterium]
MFSIQCGHPAAVPRSLRMFMHKWLDVAVMQDAVCRFVGWHDFVPFAANPHRVLETTVKNIFSFEVKKVGFRITFIVRGDGFL